MGISGKTPAAIIFWNDQSKESLVFDKLPKILRQILPLLGNLPVIQTAAEFLHRTVQKCLFLLTKAGRGHVQ